MSTSTRAPGSLRLVAAALIMGLAGCQTTPPSPVPAPVAPASLAVPAGAREYQVVGDQSLLQVFVYRGGPMARLGHNHVIASHQLSGTVFVTDDPAATRFEVHFPVARLTVDEPALRAAAGEDFPPSVPQSARDGTLHNLLSDALLDAARYPEIRLRAIDVRRAGDSFDAGVVVTLKGADYPLRVPISVRSGGDSLVASGEFALRQSELGLTPFSIAMGTLVVLDEMRVRFEITARR